MSGDDDDDDSFVLWLLLFALFGMAAYIAFSFFYASLFSRVLVAIGTTSLSISLHVINLIDIELVITHVLADSCSVGVHYHHRTCTSQLDSRSVSAECLRHRILPYEEAFSLSLLLSSCSLWI